MKKVISVMLALALLLFCAAASAETAEATAEKSDIVTLRDAFTLKCKLPEGYALEVKTRTNDSVYATLTSEDAAKPIILISIAYNDLYADIERLNDVSDEDMAVLEQLFSVMDDVKFEYRETGLGTKIMVVYETFEDVNFIDFYTIYKGYETEFVMTPGTAEISDADIQMMMDFITDLDFVPVA